MSVTPEEDSDFLAIVFAIAIVSAFFLAILFARIDAPDPYIRPAIHGTVSPVEVDHGND